MRTGEDTGQFVTLCQQAHLCYFTSPDETNKEVRDELRTAISDSELQGKKLLQIQDLALTGTAVGKNSTISQFQFVKEICGGHWPTQGSIAPFVS